MLPHQGHWSSYDDDDWKLNCDDDGDGGGGPRKRGGRDRGGSERGQSFFSPIRLMMVLFLGQVWTTCGVSASFNLFMDRHEAQKLLGLPSDIFYVREGVVNEYALNFIVKVPAAVESLVFTWQATTKRPVQYDMTLEFTDFFALLSPSSNISQTGRVPQKLESFRISLPCSGRINAEVAVNIRFTFHLKHFKGGPLSSNSSLVSKGGGNTTTINLKRNKICLLKEFIPSVDEPLTAIGTKSPTPPPFLQQPPQILDKSSRDLGGNGNGGNGNGGSSSGPSTAVSNSTLLLFQDPTPSLLLAGLLGGCVVTASIVFLIFFICLRRKLVPSSPLSSAYSSGGGIINSDPNSSSNNSSPACLLRQSTMNGGGGPGGVVSIGGDSKWVTTTTTSKTRTKDEICCDDGSCNEFKEKYHSNPNSTIGSRNSYVTIASFWNDIFGGGNNSQSTQSNGQHPHHHHQQQQQQQLHQQHQRGSSASSSACHSHHGHGNGQSRFHGSSRSQGHGGHNRPPPPSYPQILQHTNYHLNSTFNNPSSHQHQHSGSGGGGSTNNSSSIMMTKGSDVSPYAYAHIVPKIAPPPPPLIEWYSESTCNNGGHVFSNNLFTFQPPIHGNGGGGSNPLLLQHSSPAHVVTSSSSPNNSASVSAPAGPNQPPPPHPQHPQPPPIPKSQNPGLLLHSPENNCNIIINHNSNNDGNASSTTRSGGSGSLIQIDGFQCRKTLIKDGNIVERFL